MKVLVISDDKSLVENCNSIFKEKNIDIIVYRWFLKALDNLEEIKPDVIILSTAEYPRHWKVLAQFVTGGICGENIRIYLYEPTPLTMQESVKADALNIKGSFASPEELSLFFKTNDAQNVNEAFVEDEVPQVCDIEQNKEEFHKLPEANELAAFLNKQNEENKKVTNGQIIITNPLDNSFVTGKLLEKDNEKLNCMMDFSMNIPTGTNIPKITYYCGDEVHSVDANVESTDKNVVVLNINKYYEEV